MLDCVDIPTSIPLERWDVETIIASSEILQSNSTRHAAFLSDPALFDSQAYRMAHGEAVGLDPQSRLLLEQVYMAMQV